MLVKEDDVDLYSDMTILCVDDEASILRSLQRLFHRKTYHVLVADSAKQALSILQKHSVNLIISDMRMPEMDGVELLQQVAKLNPETYRIILSGYADFESTVAAINRGKIHKFINKPWNNNELVSVVEEGLEIIRLKQDNQRLRSIVEKQNEELKKWNNELESKINIRTKQIRKALKINEKNIKASKKMLFNFIAINPNLNGDFARNVANLAGRLAEKLALEKSVINDIRLAGELIEIGMLALDPLIYSSPFNLLNYAQRKEFLSQSTTAREILSPAPHMKNVSDIIENQYRPISELTLTESLMMSIKIVVIARDYWRYASGRIIPEKLDNIHIRIELTKGKNILYDEEVLKVLISHPEIITDAPPESGLTTKQLKPGMVLKYNLYTVNHLLIIAEGHEFSTSSIDHLIKYEKNQKHILSIVTEVSSSKH
jgi:response regulator RpfG family c-di-GMP phosphodiesterase